MKQRKYVAIQASSYGKFHEDCLSCGKNIEHPLCPNCLAKAFVQWLRRKGKYKEIERKLNFFMKHHNLSGGRSKKCISCGRDIPICPYCFTEYLYNLIKEAGIGIRMMSEFLYIFNFDFNHKGYYRELEAYGGW